MPRLDAAAGATPPVAAAATEPAEHVPVAVQVGERGDLKRFLRRDVPDAALRQSFARNEYQALWTGIMFFTRLPCPPWVDHNLYWISRSTVYFPLIGVAVGLFGALFFTLARILWHPAVGVVFSTLATVWLTGAFHEDGIADSFDAFGGGWTRTEILRIMRDSRIGTYGAVGLLLTMGTKLAALALILAAGSEPSVHSAAAVLVAGHVMGRWACVYLLWAHKYLDEEGSSAPGKHFMLSVSTGRLIAGTASALAFTAMAGLSWQRYAVMWVACSVTTELAGRYISGVLGGVIGDCLGAANQVVEVVTYLSLAARPWDAIASDAVTTVASVATAVGL